MTRPRVCRNTLACTWRVLASVATLAFAASSSAETAVPTSPAEAKPVFYAARENAGAKLQRLDAAQNAILTGALRSLCVMRQSRKHSLRSPGTRVSGSPTTVRYCQPEHT